MNRHSLFRVATLAVVLGSRLVAAQECPRPNVRTTSALVWAVRFIVVVTVVALVVMPSTRLLATTDPFLEPLNGWRGLFGHKNGMSAFLPFALATTLIFDRSRWVRRTTLLALGVLTVGSASVTGMIAAGAILIGYVWLRSYRMHRRAFIISTLSVAAAGIAALSLWLLWLPSETIARTKIVGKDVTFTGRSYIWRATWRAITERPLQGFGIGGIMNTDTPSPRTAQIWAEVNWHVPHAHNSVLDLWVQVGIIGLLLYLCILVPTVIAAIRNLWIRSQVSEWTILWAVSLAILSFSETAFLRGGLCALLIAHSFMTRRDDVGQTRLTP